jgi:hypothetical protein
VAERNKVSYRMRKDDKKFALNFKENKKGCEFVWTRGRNQTSHGGVI